MKRRAATWVAVFDIKNRVRREVCITQIFPARFEVYVLAWSASLRIMPASLAASVFLGVRIMRTP